MVLLQPALPAAGDGWQGEPDLKGSADTAQRKRLEKNCWSSGRGERRPLGTVLSSAGAKPVLKHSGQ